jgi:outer membrane lipoprotein SlyB
MASWEEFSRILAEAKSNKKLDPVGKEDEDIDNDGDSDSSDNYLKKKRAAVGAAIQADKKNKKCSECGKSSCECEDSDEVEEAKKWFDDDGDGIGYEKGEVSGKFKRTRKKIKNLTKEQFMGNYEGPLYAQHPDLIEKKKDSYLETDMKKRRENNEKAVEDMKKTKAHKDMVDTVRKQFEEFVPEDRELRRLAAQERAAERKEKKGHAPRSPGREGPSAGKSYADWQEISIRSHDKLTKKNKNPIGLVSKEEVELDERVRPGNVEVPLDKTSFKKRRRSLAGKEKSAEARSRGHEGKTWADTGRTYSPDEAKSGRAKMSDYNRQQRYQTAEDPDSDNADTYPVSKTKNPKKLRKQKAMGELGEGYIEEKSLSRAQQRFMGMVYAAKKGETPASPEVAKAASGMTKKAAKDFAKTKHEGLPEKKEETKEELSLVDSILSEASEAQMMAAKARREERDKKQQGRLRQAKLSTAATQAMKSEGERKEKAKEEVKRGKSARTGAERAEVIRTAGKVKAAKIQQQTEREKREEKRKAREEKRAEEIGKKQEKQKQLEKRLEQKRKEKTISKEISKADQEESDKKRKKELVGGAIKKAFSGMSRQTFSSSDPAGKALGAVAHNVAQPIGATVKAAAGAVSGSLQARSERKKREKKEKRNAEIRKKYGSEDEVTQETYSNWRTDLLIEIDDKDQKDADKVIDVMSPKKKNIIEINPKIDEAAPLIPLLARVAGSAVGRGVASRAAGSAAQGTLRSKAAELVGSKAGEIATQTVQDRMEKRFKNEPESGETFLSRLSKIGTNEGVEISEAKKSEMPCNKPKAQSHGSGETGKSHVVKACEGGKEKLIRFGQLGVKGSPKKEGESKSYASRRHRFQTRHAKNIAKGPMSAAYWANKVKW